MAGVAFLLKRQGCAVTGCDRYASPRTRWLEKNGITVAIGHSPSHLADADELVVTPAVPQSDPELAAAKGLSPQSPKGLSPLLRVRYRGEVLAEIVNAADGIAVCGTHGKTTTATFTARLLQALGTDPSWCIGGETGSMPVAGVGTGPLVVEADESDGTLALYRPGTLVLNAVDFDHLEHFKSKDDYFACYRKVVRQTARTVIVCADHPQALALVQGDRPHSSDRVCPHRIVTFGFAADAQVNAADWPNIPVSGRHNVTNALAAIAVALERGYTREQIQAALPAAVAALPDRRFELVASSNGVRVYTDYAHHPAELKCAVGMAAEQKPKRLRVLFQPHRYSRTKALLNEFPAAFAEADEVVLIPVYPAFEEPVHGGDIADLYKSFREGRAPARPPILARNATEAWRHVFLSARPGDLILLAGAGDIINLVPHIRRDLPGNHQSSILNLQSSTINLQPFSFFRTGGATVGGGERVIVGMGSNTWFSDCTTDIEIVRAPADAEPASLPPCEDIPAGIPGAAILATRPELAFMAGIPGTVGGWTKMNAGAFGDSFGNHVDCVVADGKTIPHDECGFGYRTSAIRGLITAVRLKGSRDLNDLKTAADYLGRRKKFPPRTCGSVFKNPAGGKPAGRLLEEAGAKTLSVGGASVWQEHANVITAGEGCTSSDILALARLMARAVFFSSGIRLEPEICGLEVW